jgi:hypothetical protein
MSEFSPLRDPVFLLTWQVHLAVVILFALLGIWAGMTRRPWYLAPTLFLALLWLFVPLEAPEPVVVLLLTVPVLAIVCRIARRWLDPAQEEPRESSPSRWRFSLRDLLWLTLIVALGTALVMQLKRWSWNIDWADTIISASFFVVIGITTLIQPQQKRWLPWMVGWTTVAVVIAAAAVCHYYFVRSQWLLLGWGLHFQPFFVYPNRDLHVFCNPLLTFLEFALLVSLSLPALLPYAGSEMGSTFRRRIISGGVVAVLCGTLALTYVAALRRPAWLVETFPATSGRLELLAILARHEQLNPKGESLYDFEQRGESTTVSELSDLFAALQRLLGRDDITLFDPRYDPPSSDLVNEENEATGGVRVAQHMVEALIAQAKIDYWLTDRHDLAIQRDLLALSLASTYQKRARLFDASEGAELEGLVMNHLIEIRADLRSEDIELLSELLAKLNAHREPFELTLLRDSIIDDRAAGWRLRWSLAARRILGMPPSKHWLSWYFNTRDARLAMLRTDLAIRSYRHTHRRWPASLEQLVPQELPAVPIDPFSQQPLVYRVAGDDFTLYSWGQNRQDDGGRFGTEHEHQSNDIDIDLFLDAWLP